MGEAGGGWDLQDPTAGVILMDRSPHIGVVIFFHSLMALELGTPPLLQHLLSRAGGSGSSKMVKRFQRDI